MSTAAVNLFLSRIVQEEGNEIFPYDDATGKSVSAPVGNLSWGWGFNLRVCGSVGLFRVMAQYLVSELDGHLSQETWYAALDSEPTRQSVFLDVAYNAGVDLRHHWPKMVAAAMIRDWTVCATECKVAREDLDKSRYAPLRALIISGETAP